MELVIKSSLKGCPFENRFDISQKVITVVNIVSGAAEGPRNMTMTLAARRYAAVDTVECWAGGGLERLPMWEIQFAFPCWAKDGSPVYLIQDNNCNASAAYDFGNLDWWRRHR